MENKSKDVALVLSSGGARGMAHIGVIQYLVENGYQITSVSGTSIGALIGGLHALGKLDEFTTWILGITKFDIFKLMDFAISKNGILKGEKIFNHMEYLFDHANIEDLDIPYAAVAVDIQNLKEIVFKSGELSKAIRASVAIPTILKPSMRKNIEMVDGGVLSPLPIDFVERKKNDLLVVVDLNADIPYRNPKNVKHTENQNHTYSKALEYINSKWSEFFSYEKNIHTGYFDLISQSIYGMQAKLTQIAIKKHNPEFVVQISRKACDTFEFHRSEELIEYGRKQCKKAMGK